MSIGEAPDFESGNVISVAAGALTASLRCDHACVSGACRNLCCSGPPFKKSVINFVRNYSEISIN